MKEPFDTTRTGAQLPESLRNRNNISTLTYDPENSYSRTRQSLGLHNLSSNTYIREEDNSSLSSFTQFRNIQVKKDIEKYTRNYLDSSFSREKKQTDMKQMLRSACRELK